MKQTLLAIACGMACNSFAHAEADNAYVLDEIVVTAKRFGQGKIHQPANVLVLRREEITNSGATALPELLQRFSGLNIRSLFGEYPASVDIDARGFGETGSSHVLVLLNGRRLNAVDSNAVENWSAIPLSQIERVEVIYGSNTVLYGDNAVGAVVNIITDGASSPARRVALRAGSFNTREGSLTINGDSGKIGYSLNAQLAHSDSYRDNNAMDIGNLGGRLSLPIANSFIDFGYARHDAELPAYLTLDEYHDDPRASYEANGNGWSKKHGWFLRPGFSKALRDKVDLQMELGVDDSRLESFIPAWSWSNSHVDTTTRTYSLTPRLNVRHALADIPADTVLGIDLYRTDYDSNRSPAPDAPTAMQTDMQVDSRALYLQSTLHGSDALAITMGARRQWVDESASREGSQLENNQAKSALDIGASYQISDTLRAFARHGSTFRFPKTDELTTFSGLGIGLRPEYGRSSDLGLEWKANGKRLQAGLYRLSLNDEIAYNPDPDGDIDTYDGRNENLDKTRHQGVTIDGRYPFGSSFVLSGGYAYTDAKFTAGSVAGENLALVPKHKLHLVLDWNPTANWKLSTSVLHIGERPYAVSDTANLGVNMLPSYTTLDMTAAWQKGPWTVQVTGKNLTDKRYFSTGYDWSSPWGPFFAVYPNDGRALFLTLVYREDS